MFLFSMLAHHDKKTKTALMREIRDEVFNLKESPLYAERVKNKAFPVIGEGNHDAEIMFVGEAPGRNEAATGRPFCGAAGKILDELLSSIDVPRAEVYITNIVKDRPPYNRDPAPEEIVAYAPFLDRQISIIEPTVIATLGRYAMNYIFEKFNILEHLRPISEIHGKAFEAKACYGLVKIVPLYHPAVAIYRPETKDNLKKDFRILKDLK
jgi:DNA polymerase